MKKILIATCLLTLTMATSANAVETYTGALLKSVQKKIDAKAAPIVNKEQQLRQQQADAKALSQKQVLERQKQIEAQQKAQLELVNKKKQQVQTQKDLFNQQKKEIKGLFSVQ